MRALFLSLLFLLPLTVLAGGGTAAFIRPEHLACEAAADCVMVNLGGCCNGDQAVNKKFTDTYFKPPAMRCRVEKHACPKVEVECVNKKCRRKFHPLLDRLPPMPFEKKAKTKAGAPKKKPPSAAPKAKH